MENKNRQNIEGVKITKYIPACTVCRKCCGNIYGSQPHNCEDSLKQRFMKFSTNPPKYGLIEDMSPEERARAEQDPTKEISAVVPDDLAAELKFKEICESIIKKSSTIKTSKELQALFERFNKADAEYLEAYPSRIESEAHPEFVQETVDKLTEIKNNLKIK